MDLRDKEDPKRQLYHERKADIEEVNRKLGEGEGEENLDQAGFLRCFPTSIWDESLYKVRLIELVVLDLIKVYADTTITRHGHQSFTL